MSDVESRRGRGHRSPRRGDRQRCYRRYGSECAVVRVRELVRPEPFSRAVSVVGTGKDSQHLSVYVYTFIRGKIASDQIRINAPTGRVDCDWLDQVRREGLIASVFVSG